jgi:hypothetical protein
MVDGDGGGVDRNWACGCNSSIFWKLALMHAAVRGLEDSLGSPNAAPQGSDDDEECVCASAAQFCRALLSRDCLQQVLAGRSVRSQAPLPLLPPLDFPRPPVQGIKRCRRTLGRFTLASLFPLACLVMHLPQVWQGASPSQARFTSACLISLSFRQFFSCRNLSLAEAGAYDYAEVVKSSSVSVSSR